MFYENIIDDVEELHDEFLMSDAVLGRNRQICGDNWKTLKFAEVAKIREFCKSCNVRKKFTAIIIMLILQ